MNNEINSRLTNAHFYDRKFWREKHEALQRKKEARIILSSTGTYLDLPEDKEEVVIVTSN